MGEGVEGQRAGQMSYTTAPKAASYATIGEEDGATFEANAEKKASALLALGHAP